MYPFKDTTIENMLFGCILASDRESNDNTLHIAGLSLVLPILGNHSVSC